MKIYDISQEVLGSVVFPGDPVPRRTVLKSIAEGAPSNLSAISMCSHNGTHMDAPRHFVEGGRTVDQIDLSVVIGTAFVAEHRGTVTGEDARQLLAKAAGIPRLLIKGEAEVSPEAAQVFARSGLVLLGNESQTVGPPDTRREVHRTLLGADMVLLEGIRLGAVPEGVYLLNGAPLNFAGSEGAPCRAVLLDLEEGTNTDGRK